MINATYKISLALAAIFFLGCSNKTGLLDSSTVIANEQSLADLASLMAAHPELSQASLKDIKAAASNAQVTTNALDANFAADAGLKQAVLDKAVAEKAQNLIDTILEDFNLEAQLNADFKIIGIAMNLQRDVMDKMENADSLNAKSSFPNDVMGAVKAAQAPQNEVILATCEQIMENPYGNMPKEKITKMLKESREALKASVSGCSKIQGKPFVQCMEYFNKMAAIVNKHASCNMRNFDDLAKIAEKEFKKSFSDIQNASRDCMSNQFFSCGFKIQNNPKSELKPAPVQTK